MSLEACIAEVFGADGLVDTTGRYLALPLLRRDVRLLDLRGNGAMRAGTVAALTKVDDYLLTQAWSRLFYKRQDRGARLVTAAGRGARGWYAGSGREG